MFNNIHYLFEMKTMKRFKDPVLVTILEKMRRTNGAKLSEQEWQALLNTEIDASEIERDPETYLRDTAGWYESAYLWSIVSMACYTRAKASAQQHQQTLFFCQAVDFSEQVVQRHQRDIELYKQMLAVPSVAQSPDWQIAGDRVASPRHAGAHYNAGTATMGSPRCNRNCHGTRRIP